MQRNRHYSPNATAGTSTPSNAMHQGTAVAGTDATLRAGLAASGCLLPSGLVVQLDNETSFQSVDKTDPKNMTATFTIVSRGKERNRNGNIVQIKESEHGKGMLLDDYQRNPIVLFNHGYGDPLPIGLSQDRSGKFLVKASATKMAGTCVFHQHTELAATIFAMVDDGILRMASIGFNPLLAMRLSDKQMSNPGAKEGTEDWGKWRGGWDFVESRLTEWSIVPIGADASALRQHLEAGQIHGERIGEGTTRILMPFAESRQAWCPGLPVFAPKETQSGDEDANYADDLVTVSQDGVTVSGKTDSVIRVMQSIRPQPVELQGVVDDTDDTSEDKPTESTGVDQSSEPTPDLGAIVAAMVAQQIRPLTEQMDRLRTQRAVSDEALRFATDGTF